jgi:nitroimidazol reductase NimA-like FMN-containing flavoprotein (pyridoxamine 5'-phosphate oxidase superfamily)
MTDRSALYQVLDEALVCHVAFVHEGHPVAIPMTYGRAEEQLYLHGSTGSRMLRALAGGAPVCVTVTLLDGLVLARSVFHHSMNYRSAVILGVAAPLAGRAEKLEGLRAVVDHIAPGRWGDARPPSPKELAATVVLSLPLNEASVKVRTGPPNDDDGDYALPVWAGVIPLTLVAGSPQDDPRLTAELSPPDYVTTYRRSVRQ